MNLGMTNREAALFERYLVETEHDPNPAHWPIWFKSFTNLSPTELSMSQTIPLDTLVESLTLSPRSHNALRRYGISTVKQLLATNLFTVRNLGHKSIVEIRKALEGFSEQRSIQ